MVPAYTKATRGVPRKSLDFGMTDVGHNILEV